MKGSVSIDRLILFYEFVMSKNPWQPRRKKKIDPQLSSLGAAGFDEQAGKAKVKWHPTLCILFHDSSYMQFSSNEAHYVS